MFRGHTSAQVTVLFWSHFDYKSLYETKITCSAFRLVALKHQKNTRLGLYFISVQICIVRFDYLWLYKLITCLANRNEPSRWHKQNHLQTEKMKSNSNLSRYMTSVCLLAPLNNKVHITLKKQVRSKVGIPNIRGWQAYMCHECRSPVGLSPPFTFTG